MGNAVDGALGVKNFLRPDKGRKKVFKRVVEVSCGYAFTVFGLKEKDHPPFFGTGVASSCQIGSHMPRKGHPLEVLIQPCGIPIPLSRKSTVKKIACGRAHTMIYTDTEGVWTFGNNAFGQCGRPVNEKEVYFKNARYENIKMFNGKIVDQLECGQDTSFVLIDGQVYSCGMSNDGQTGLGTYKRVESFRPIEGDLKGERVVKISCRADCALALTEKGDVFGWGNSEYRQLSSIDDEQQVSIPRKLNLKNISGKIIDIAASGTSCYVVTDAHDVWSWGYGALGVGPQVITSEDPVLIPRTLLGRNVLNPDSKVMKVFAGMSFAAAVTDNGSLYTWGRNKTGYVLDSIVKKVACGIDHMVLFTKSVV
ncbi:Williams-Beuren syndrome chromosomal region 16-like protein [Armadillidium nasatum]|uniref:Williams-Beuren syndrome chromosomal region 16-like protein n=1 Tax=Armadillidium nasatum TaxID=96803 RepID=A0A5N5TBU8_9CRUS|nr:Williams-Beuren syndrome chromosomal region 16-like protein [Armadillidium nasatum]